MLTKVSGCQPNAEDLLVIFPHFQLLQHTVDNLLSCREPPRGKRHLMTVVCLHRVYTESDRCFEVGACVYVYVYVCQYENCSTLVQGALYKGDLGLH